MTSQKLEADYLIVGSGAVGMAFADVILHESDATMIIVDRYAKPGGHWNVAYPFVTLHQPSSTYGVSSKELSQGRTEMGGLNDGLEELATGAEVSAYFDDVMRHQFLPSGRVQYFPMCDYQGDGHFVSTVSGKEYHAAPKGKLVDATHLNISVPSTHTPDFEIEDGVRFMPLNNLPKVDFCPDGYVIIGAGKTGIDAILWLLAHDVDPDRITWIVNRDAWLLDRQNTQTRQEFFFDTLGTHADQMQSVAEATSIDDMFNRLEKCGYFLRVDTSVKPKMFHGATSSKAEVQQLRRVKNIVRKGYVTAIKENEIALERGTLPTTRNTVHVDCSAQNLRHFSTKPVFEGNVITPQMIRPFQPVFSAAVIAHVELNYDTEEEKNKLTGVVPLPNHDTDYIYFTLASLSNQLVWSQTPELSKWIGANRLDAAKRLVTGIKDGETGKYEVLSRIKKYSPLAAQKLMQFTQELSSAAGK